MQIWIAKKGSPNNLQHGSGRLLGGVWDGLGCLLVALGRLWVVLGAFKIELFSRLGLRYAPRSLLDRFLVDFGGFWADLGWVLEEFREDFDEIYESF